MKKSGYILFLFWLLPNAFLFSKTVSIAEALRVATAFVERDNTRPQLRSTIAGFSVSTIDPITTGTNTVAFLVTLGPQGFLIMSAITELSPVRFISYSGNYDSLKGHPLIKYLIAESDSTASALGYYDSSEGKRSIETSIYPNWDVDQLKQNESLWTIRFSEAGGEPPSKMNAAVSPMISTSWGQGHPYNLYVPALVNRNGQNEQTVTGCVATAQSQIMNYWRYPDKGQGSHSYYWNAGGMTLGGSFDSYYRWDLMRDSYGGRETPEQMQAVAVLMRDVGYSVNMQYGLAASSASTRDIESNNSLVNYFKYSSELTIDLRIYHANSGSWFAEFKNQIDKGWPALLSIFDSSQSVGHRVVVDGYRTDSGNQLHLNMGWDGHYDTYYSLDAIINPGGTFTSTESQGAIINIHPPELAMGTLNAAPPLCSISGGSDRCSVTVLGTNPSGRLVQLWAKGPNDIQEKAITGAFSDTTFSVAFDWVFEGTVTFHLRDVSGSSKALLAVATAMGTRGAAASETITAVPFICSIAGGSNRCSVNILGTNSSGRLVQVWAKGPNDSQEKAITGGFSDTTFSFDFDWVFEGTVTFYLYGVSGSSKALLATATATGTRGSIAREIIIAVPSTCSITGGSNRCSVTILGMNPDRKVVQLWAKGPNDIQEKAITGAFSDTTFSVAFDWVFPGTVTFNLYDVYRTGKILLAMATATGKRAVAGIELSFSPNAVSRSSDGKWHYSVLLQETNGVGIHLTKLVIGGRDYSDKITSWFGSSRLPPFGQLSVNIESSGYSPPTSLLWQVTGNDDSGNIGLTWSGTVQLLQ